MSARTIAVDDCGLNTVVLVGEITSPTVSRELADGSVVSTFDMATRGRAGRISVPVSVPGDADFAEVGEKILVAGHVRRRFFRTGASVASRTEVVASVALPLRRRAQVRRALDGVMEELSSFLDR